MFKNKPAVIFYSTVILLEKSLNISLYKHKEYHCGQYPSQVKPEPLRKLHTLPSISFSDKAVPAPAESMTAEQHECDRADRQQVIAQYEILKIHQAGPSSKRLYPREDIEPQNAGQSQKGKYAEIHPGRLTTIPLPHVHAVGNDVLHHSDDRRQSRNAHKNKEQCSPETAAYHFIKYIGQSDENQPRPGSRLHAEGEAGREYYEAGHQRHQRIEAYYEQRLLRYRALFAKIAPEYAHGSYAEPQSEKSLIHSIIDEAPYASIQSPLPVGGQIEG